jgi:hypothetical protein
MVQGGKQALKRKPLSGGAQKKKSVVKVDKGKMQIVAKKTKKRNRDEEETTKAINRKNERIVSSRAVLAGSKFFLSDIGDSGKLELEQQRKKREKKEGQKRMEVRMKDQLKKIDTQP